MRAARSTQACTHATVVALLLLLVPAAAGAAGFGETLARGGWLAFLLAFGFGIATSLTPCVLPMVPITLAVFGGRGVPRRRALLLATVYVSGISVMYGALGTTFALLGRMWGSFLGSPWVAVPLALLFAALGLAMLGVFDVVLPQSLQERLSRIGGRGVLGAFLMGLVGGLIAAPCTAPPLAAMLAFVSTTGRAGHGFALLATYAAGIGVPFWLLAGFSMAIRPGAWMDRVKQAFGVVMLATALYYLRPVLPFLKQPGAGTLGLLWGLGLAALGLLAGTLRSLQRARAVGVVMMVLGLLMTINSVLTPRTAPGLTWASSEAKAVQAAQAAGRPVVIDFAAEWCLPCKEMETRVFADPEVAEALLDFTLVRVDVTQDTDENMALRRRYAADTLPAVRVLSRDGRVVGRVDRLIGAREMLDVLRQAR